jgi:hypothetical protein
LAIIISLDYLGKEYRSLPQIVKGRKMHNHKQRAATKLLPPKIVEEFKSGHLILTRFQPGDQRLG